VEGAQEPAEDVVDDQREQQQGAPHEEADAEYEVRGRQATPTSA
jgi:hypothetical protein